MTAANILAKLLRAYGINSKRLNLKDGRPQGYRREQFGIAWERHLLRQTRQTVEIREKRPDSKARQRPDTQQTRQGVGSETVENGVGYGGSPCGGIGTCGSRRAVASTAKAEPPCAKSGLAGWTGGALTTRCNTPKKTFAISSGCPP
jgi:hypothetical protein